MTKKEFCLENLHKAKNSHENEMIKLEMVFKGSLPENPTPRGSTECFLGKWFYSSPNLNKYLGPQLYQKLEALHNQWHSQYTKIYDIYFKEEKKGFFKKLKKHQPSQMEKDKAAAYYDDLKKITQELLHTLIICERRLKALSDSKFV